MSEIRLRVHDADPERVERLRLRCVSVLEARRRAERRDSRASFGKRWLEPAVAIGACALYLALAVTQALALVR